MLYLPKWINGGVLSIFLTEAAERFNYYGISSLLTLFLMRGPASLSASMAAASYSGFSGLAYLTPLLGSALAATSLGMFGTILLMSTVYLCGMILLPIAALHSNPGAARFWTFLSLFLVATGTGGIKPNVAAFGALQVGAEESNGRSDSGQSEASSSVSKFFAAFYFVINVGSIFGQLTVPAVQRWRDYSAAFAVAAVVLLLAIVIFVGGEFCTTSGYRHERQDYIGNTERRVHVAEYVELRDRDRSNDDNDQSCSKDTESHEFVPSDLIKVTFRSRFGCNMPAAYRAYSRTVVEQLAPAVLTLRLVALLPLYWAGYNCMNSLWIQQVETMSLPLNLSASQWTAINPITVLIALPVASLFGHARPKERQIVVGMFLGFSCLLASSVIQWNLIGEQTEIGKATGLWTLPQWIGLSVSEVLTSVPSLALCYARAPRGLRSAMQAAWLLSSAAGSMCAAFVFAILGIVNAGPTVTLATLAIIMGVGALLFARESTSQSRLLAAEITSDLSGN